MTLAAMTPEKFEEICNTLETTSIGVRAILHNSGFDPKDFYRYMKKVGETARQRYAHAKVIQCEVIAEEMLDIADESTNDFMTVMKGDKGLEVENKEAINRARLRVDTRKWLLSKLIPKKYGDKVDLNHNGNISVMRVEYPKKSDIGDPVQNG